MMLLIFVVVLLEIVSHVSGACRESYVIFCDDFEDVAIHKWNERWMDLVIGNEDDISKQQLISWNMMYFDKYRYLENLHSLTIIGKLNDLGSSRGGYCNHKVKLQYLKFYKNNIPTLKTNFFPQFENKLQYLGFSYNNIDNIEQYAFSFEAVEFLDLSHNNLKVIIEGSFLTGSTINLNHNKIVYLEPSCFPKDLQVLRLDYNELHYIQMEVFDNLSNLVELSLAHNHFTSILGIPSLNNLEFLYLSHNTIRLIDKLPQFDNLKILDLSHNALAYAEFLKEVIARPRSDKIVLKILLTFNRLKKIDIGNVTVDDSVELSLFGNPWDCDDWPSIKQTIEDLQPKCDKEYFDHHDGKVPYCVVFSKYLSIGDKRELDVDQFLNILKKANIEECRERQSFYYGGSIACVA